MCQGVWEKERRERRERGLGMEQEAGSGRCSLDGLSCRLPGLVKWKWTWSPEGRRRRPHRTGSTVLGRGCPLIAPAGRSPASLLAPEGHWSSASSLVCLTLLGTANKRSREAAPLVRHSRNLWFIGGRPPVGVITEPQRDKAPQHIAEVFLFPDL